MSRLINADELKSKFLEMGCMDDEPCYGVEIIDRMPTVQAIPISENATNGDVIKAVFPDIEISDGKGLSKVYTGIPYGELIGANIDCMKEWWNTPYKGSDTE